MQLIMLGKQNIQWMIVNEKFTFYNQCWQSTSDKEYTWVGQ
jgi:hypothetical protein